VIPTTAEGIVHSADDVALAVFGDHPHNDPAQARQIWLAPNVFHVLFAVGAMAPASGRYRQVAVVLGGHLEVFSAHVEDADKSPAVDNRYLRDRPGKSRIDQFAGKLRQEFCKTCMST
jgi:hypothetical protein